MERSVKRMAGWKVCVLCICLALFLAGCGSSPAKEMEKDISLYRNGMLLVDLADADTYYSEGKKLAKVMEGVSGLMIRTVDAFSTVLERIEISLCVLFLCKGADL